MRPEYDFKGAIGALRKRGIAVKDEAYGFSLSDEDAQGRMTAECGIEHDGSVSLSVRSKKPPAAWFFRKNVTEIVVLISAAQSLLSEKKESSWVGALKASDTETSS